MPIPIAEAVAEQADLARTKAGAVKNVPKFLFSSALAGAYVGVGIVLLAIVMLAPEGLAGLFARRRDA